MSFFKNYYLKLVSESTGINKDTFYTKPSIFIIYRYQYTEHKQFVAAATSLTIEMILRRALIEYIVSGMFITNTEKRSLEMINGLVVRSDYL